jgi:hypothetical protein
MDLPDILYIHVFKHSLPQVFFAGETMPYARCRIVTDAQVGMLGSLTHRLSFQTRIQKMSPGALSRQKRSFMM